ncbi:MFS general substrate transporter [Purpureocillium lavendulum]|uniref:MFS general substrate transporter n=1 Tax=Purpureocillium lavendulum TaxID=1247861 RepID=A0AB34FVB5_9HYPO|nr:MFS general substrate transporter [Purpureocillium lavendulum]
MASLQVHSSALGGHHGPVKITKSRNRTVVKPILKKLQSHHSDRESLDLDRGWDDQPSPRLSSLDFGSGPYDSDGGGYFGPSSQYGTSAGAGRSARDVSFSLASGDLSSGVGGRGKYSHARSTSGTSHASIATTNSSGRNGGTFVHPFQQTPQMATATPLAYTNPRTSFDNSPTITEDDGDDVDPYASYHSTTSSASRPTVYQAVHLQQGQRRPSLASQRTGSASDGAQTLRATANRSHSGSVQRLTSSSVNQSRSELQLSTANSVVDSPLSTTAPLTTSATLLSSTQGGAASTATTVTPAQSCSSSASPMSPLRSSLDMGGFRLRSRSEVDTFTRQEHVREARRKFEAKERAKEEKYAREQSRKRERADTKQERGHSRPGRDSHGSLPGGINPAGIHRRRTPKPDPVADEPNEKDVRASRGADGVSDSQPRADSVQFKSPKRSKTAKHKTMGVWTSFVLWLRTRLLKLGRR